MTPTVLAGPGELASVVESVFETMMHLPVRRSYEIPPPHGEMITAAVHLTGAFQGAVLLHCPPWQACGLAGHFQQRTPPSAVDDDVLDVMGELANMIAGNLKCTLLPGTQLSVPTVLQGPDSTPRFCGTRPVQRSAFETSIGPIWVTMFAQAST